MRKTGLLALLLAALFLLSSCVGAPNVYHYTEGEHTHVYVASYDITPLSCTEEGLVIAYCKICRKTALTTVPIAQDIADRVHSFKDTVVPATESTEGYTVRDCQSCAYHIDRANVTPALYALLFQDGVTSSTAPDGVDALLVSDTLSHVLSYQKDGDVTVNGTFAARLAIALTITEELEREDSTLTVDSAISVTVGGLAGNTYTLQELLFALIHIGGDDVTLALAEALGESSSSFHARVMARATRLGVASELTLAEFDTASADTATLHATAVLLARALDTPLIAAALTAAVPALTRVAGKSPLVYFVSEDSMLRVTALKIGDTVVFALLYGNDLPRNVENGIYL